MCIDRVVKKLNGENANFNGCLGFTESRRIEMSAHIHVCPSTEFTCVRAFTDVCGSALSQPVNCAT